MGEDKKKVLLVEDDPHTNRLLTYHLAGRGYCVKAFYDGAHAFLALSKERFDIALLDVMLPGLDGLRLCRSIKDNPVFSGTSVVIISALAQLDDKLNASLARADRYITKPFSITKLIEEIDELSTVHNRKFSISQGGDRPME